MDPNMCIIITGSFKGGQPSWREVVDRAKLLLDAGVDVNALSVVNDYSVHYPDEIYSFHKELGLNYMQFIPCVETDPLDPSKATSFSVSAEDYGKFLVRLFDLWLSDFDGSVAPTSIRYFDSVLHKYIGLNAPDCTLLKECGVYVVVEHNGDVYSCDFFVQHTAGFRILYVFVVMEIASRKVIHMHVTDHPVLEWTQQQIRNACFEEQPKFLLHDNDGKFGQLGHPFRVESGGKQVSCRSAYDVWLWQEMRIRGIPVPYGAPNAAAHIERLIGTLRRECLDRLAELLLLAVAVGEVEIHRLELGDRLAHALPGSGGCL
jgi:hypothetical protein